MLATRAPHVNMILLWGTSTDSEHGGIQNPELRSAPVYHSSEFWIQIIFMRTRLGEIMELTRRNFVKSGAMLGAGATFSAGYLAELLRAARVAVKIGATDWNLRREVKPDAIELAKKIGFDGVEVSLGVGTDRLPL